MWVLERELCEKWRKEEGGMKTVRLKLSGCRINQKHTRTSKQDYRVGIAPTCPAPNSLLVSTSTVCIFSCCCLLSSNLLPVRFGVQIFVGTHTHTCRRVSCNFHTNLNMCKCSRIHLKQSAHHKNISIFIHAWLMWPTTIKQSHVVWKKRTHVCVCTIYINASLFVFIILQATLKAFMHTLTHIPHSNAVYKMRNGNNSEPTVLYAQQQQRQHKYSNKQFSQIYGVPFTALFLFIIYDLSRYIKCPVKNTHKMSQKQHQQPHCS